LILLLLAGCATSKPYQINLMPAPDIFKSNGWQPFDDTRPIRPDGTMEIIFATDRAPSEPKDPKSFYRNQRGSVLRLGKAQIKLGKGEHTWEEMKKISLLKNRTTNLPLQVVGIKEYGILDSTVSPLAPPRIHPLQPKAAAQQYAASINRRLARSRTQDIYIYVHGFKVNFENPLLVASELWHYLGYNGLFIAFAWPSTPSVWAYAADAETATVSSRNLRLFLQYLARETIAREIHVVGYSAGTRLVVQAINDLALIYTGESKQTIYDQLRIGHVTLVSSDVDRDFFGNLLLDGFLKVPRRTTVYASSRDRALGMSRWFYSHNRLGKIEGDANVPPHIADLLFRQTDLEIIDVSDAEGARTGNGHAYFRKSPWASSDILVTLAYDFRPAERGLVRTAENPIWVFPPDYVTRLKSNLAQSNPALSPLAD